MPTFAELGIPFPLFEADVSCAGPEYKELATCALCGQTRAHCFTVDEIILPCAQCDREMAFVSRQAHWPSLDEQQACPHCGATQPALAAPRDQYQHFLVCYACLRAGRAAIRKETILGMVTWQPAQAGHTWEVPFEPEPDHEERPPGLLTDGSSVMLPIEPKSSRYAALAARYGFERVIVARKPMDPGGPVMDWEAIRIPQEHLMELLRTPTYGTWQGECWFFCCQQPMVYLGDWKPADFERYAGAGNGRALFETVVADAVHWLWDRPRAWERGGAGIHVFRCPACGRLNSHWDFD